MKQKSPDNNALLDALRLAVDEALERKRRLGHYAVFWENGEIFMEGEDAPVHDRYPTTRPRRDLWIEEDRD